MKGEQLDPTLDRGGSALGRRALDRTSLCPLELQPLSRGETTPGSEETASHRPVWLQDEELDAPP
jgi:hypothetical protein